MKETTTNFSVLQPATEQTQAVCDDIVRLIRAYLEAKFLEPLGEFEADVEAYTLLKVMTRHTESVVELARNDLVLLPSATVLARASFEASILTRWMIRPEDRLQKEVRWLLHLRTARKHWRKLADRPNSTPDLKAKFAQQQQLYHDFGDEIEKLLRQKGYSIPTEMPNTWEMLKDLGESDNYSFYIHLSAYTHSNFEAGTLYRKNLGCGKELGEFIVPANWSTVFDVVWKSFFLTARDFLNCVRADVIRFESLAAPLVFERHLNELRNCSSSPQPG